MYMATCGRVVKVRESIIVPQLVVWQVLEQENEFPIAQVHSAANEWVPANMKGINKRQTTIKRGRVIVPSVGSHH